MKKKMALVLTIAMISATALTGCGGSSKAPAKETQAAAETTAETEAAETEAAETEVAETEAAETEAAETEAAVADTASEEEALAALGHVDGKVYTNETFGINFEGTDDWYIASPEELAQIQGLAADAVQDEDLADQLRESGSIYDFYAQNTENSANINVIIQDVGLFQGFMLNNTTKLIEEVIPQVETALTSAGYENVVCEQGSVTYKGADKACISTSFTTQGIDVVQRQIYEISSQYLAVITVSAASEEDAQAVFDLFK